MYRTCIFCSAKLGSNDVIERFPIGRTLAFDAAKGRLWAVCPKCARWNLSPIEERWEAIDDAEKLFRDTRLRAQSENIGIAKLRDGTRLIRVGAALRGELAVWRYGRGLVARRRQYLLTTGAMATATAALTGSVVAGFGGLGLLVMLLYKRYEAHAVADELYQFGYRELRRGMDTAITVPMLRQAKLVPSFRGEGIALRFPNVGTAEIMRDDGPSVRRPIGITLRGTAADTVLRKGMVRLNAVGAPQRRVQHAVDLLGADGAGAYVAALAQRKEPVFNMEVGEAERRTRALALEMALHEETERRAMEGELAALEAMWREAEGLAAIADRLPDVPASDPPRLKG